MLSGHILFSLKKHVFFTAFNLQGKLFERRENLLYYQAFSKLKFDKICFFLHLCPFISSFFGLFYRHSVRTSRSLRPRKGQRSKSNNTITATYCFSSADCRLWQLAGVSLLTQYSNLCHLCADLFKAKHPKYLNLLKT